MAKFAALISDVDRTLLDTEQFIFQAFLHALNQFNLPTITKNELNPLMGRSLETCYEIIAPTISSKELAESHRSFQEKNLQLSKPFPHTLQTLKTLHQKGIKIAAVTTRSKRTSEKTLELSGLMPFLTTVISKEDLFPNELKPHPKPILLALEQMELLPKQAIVMGDADEDIEAGRRARAKTIGVTYGSSGKKILQSKPDYIVNDILEIIPLIV